MMFLDKKKYETKHNGYLGTQYCKPVSKYSFLFDDIQEIITPTKFFEYIYRSVFLLLLQQTQCLRIKVNFPTFQKNIGSCDSWLMLCLLFGCIRNQC